MKEIWIPVLRVLFEKMKRMSRLKAKWKYVYTLKRSLFIDVLFMLRMSKTAWGLWSCWIKGRRDLLRKCKASVSLKQQIVDLETTLQRQRWWWRPPIALRKFSFKLLFQIVLNNQLPRSLLCWIIKANSMKHLSLKWKINYTEIRCHMRSYYWHDQPNLERKLISKWNWFFSVCDAEWFADDNLYLGKKL